MKKTLGIIVFVVGLFLIGFSVWELFLESGINILTYLKEDDFSKGEVSWCFVKIFLFFPVTCFFGCIISMIGLDFM